MTLSKAATGANVRRRWTPKALGANLVAWYDADVSSSITSDANGVSQWDDLSGNGKHLTQTTNANKPSYASSRVSFDGGDFLDSTVSASAISRCAAAVVNYTETANVQENIVGVKEGNNGWGFGRRASGGGADYRKLYIAKTGVIRIGQTTGTLADDVDGVVVGNTTSTTWRMSINGTGETGSHSQSLSANLNMRINGEAANYALLGSMRELVIAASLSTADQQRLEGYLAWKWGLQGNLAAGHPYKSFRP